MSRCPAPPAPHPQAPDLSEVLRQSLSGLLPGDPWAALIDRLEGRK